MFSGMPLAVANALAYSKKSIVFWKLSCWKSVVSSWSAENAGSRMLVKVMPINIKPNKFWIFIMFPSYDWFLAKVREQAAIKKFCTSNTNQRKLKLNSDYTPLINR